MWSHGKVGIDLAALPTRRAMINVAHPTPREMDPVTFAILPHRGGPSFDMIPSF
jgi:hypothetical protein